jgi:hypothetical protein
LEAEERPEFGYRFITDELWAGRRPATGSTGYAPSYDGSRSAPAHTAVTPTWTARGACAKRIVGYSINER